MQKIIRTLVSTVIWKTRIKKLSDKTKSDCSMVKYLYSYILISSFRAIIINESSPKIVDYKGPLMHQISKLFFLMLFMMTQNIALSNTNLPAPPSCGGFTGISCTSNGLDNSNNLINYDKFSSSDKEIVHFDSFSDTVTPWYIGTGSDEALKDCLSFDIDGENYVMTSVCDEVYPMSWLSNTDALIDSTRNFELEASFTFGDGTNNAFALFWGSDYDLNQRRFQISVNESNQYKIKFHYWGSFITIKDWTSFTHQTQQPSYKITVRMVEDDYYFYINEELIYITAVKPSYGNRFGFISNQHSTLYVDYVHYAYLSAPDDTKANTSQTKEYSADKQSEIEFFEKCITKYEQDYTGQIIGSSYECGDFICINTQGIAGATSVVSLALPKTNNNRLYYHMNEQWQSISFNDINNCE